ncbi:glucose-1-phosphate adenylyltransferase [bacterium]|nr:glucose-1-phosphate adenylyltransferase [bacterium]
MIRDVLAFILAGGEGKRLYPLTKDRAKPAVPFGGIYRIIDFTLSNCLNSNIRRIYVLPQYKYESMDRHLRMTWNIFSIDVGEFIISIPPQKRIDENWYQGTANAIYQNLHTLENEASKYILILSGDHIYKMDYSEMLSFHKQKKADVTVAAIEVEKNKASGFGIIQVDNDMKIIGFEEKPIEPKTIPGNSDICFASMGVYIFNVPTLIELLEDDAWQKTEHDFGKNIIPMAFEKKVVYAYNFRDENKKSPKYWRDVGTLDAYWEANMDLVSVDPQFNLYDKDWPIRTYHPQSPPAKFVFADEFIGYGKRQRFGVAIDSIISNGCILSGGRVQNSVLSPDVRVNSYSYVTQSVLMEGVEIGRYAKIRNAIIDKGVYIPPHTIIGYNMEQDRRLYEVTPSGIVVVPKNAVF